MLFVIGGVGLAFASAAAVVVVRARRRRAENETRAAAEREARRPAEEARRRAEKEARVAAEQEAQREAEEARSRADEEARAAAEREAQRKLEEAHRHAQEEARAAAEREAQRKVEEARRRAEEEGRAAAERELQRHVEEARRRAEEEARAAAEREAQRETEEARRRAEEDGRAASEREVQRRVEEARKCADEEVRAAAERGAQSRAGDDARAAEREAQRQAEAARRRAEEEPRNAAGLDAQAADTSGGSIEGGSPGGRATTPTAPGFTPRAPRQYRPTARAPASQRGSAPPSAEREVRDRAMPIEVRLEFEKAGFCRLSLLPRRSAEMPVEFAVAGSGDPPALLALQDEWYQDVVLPDLGRLLIEGIEWAGALPNGGAGRLSLSGRDLYVLARHGELNGFVSTPRLVLGEEHVVLCVANLLPQVRAAIALTESPEAAHLNSDSGIPAGWAGLRGVRPRRPVAPSPDGDILDALRPLPDVEIALNGGIRIDRQTWLSGFPPAIQLLGDTSSAGVVVIDGQEASPSPDAVYVVPGWDSPGEHAVSCTSSSRTYTIRSGAEEWEPWDAYAWSLGEPSASGTQPQPAICGVLLLAPQAARPDSRPTVVAASNPVLIGARPGEIEVCAHRVDVRAGLCVGFPWFAPIWAIPADALHCDKRTARVLLIGPPTAVARGDHEPSTRGATSRRTPRWIAQPWCAAILDAGRKGLRTEPSGIEIANLWKTYKRYAKSLRRGRR